VPRWCVADAVEHDASTAQPAYASCPWLTQRTWSTAPSR
jgi:hypothetical protein